MVDGNTTKYFLDGSNVIADYDGGDTLLATYVTPGLDANLSQERGGSTYYYMADGLGSIRNLVDSSEDTQNTYDYYAFGRELGTWTENVTNRYTYTAREWDAESGIYYYRARYYSGGGKFNSRDPVDGLRNLYAYVKSMPCNRVDPTGLTDNGAWMNMAPLPKGTGKPMDFFFYNEALTITGVNNVSYPMKDWANNLNYSAGKPLIIGVESISEMIKELDDELDDKQNPRCKCISQLHISTHGGVYDPDTGIGAGGFSFGDPNKNGGVWDSATATAFSKIIKPALCETCEINVMACNSAGHEAASDEQVLRMLAQKTGCQVKGAKGVFQATVVVKHVPFWWDQVQQASWWVEYGIEEFSPNGTSKEIQGPGATGIMLW